MTKNLWLSRSEAVSACAMPAKRAPFALAALAAIAAIMLAGCGGGDGASGAGGSAANSASTMSPAATPPADQALTDTNVYGTGPNDSVDDAKEAVAVSHHSVTIGGESISYTARAGHLTTIYAQTSQPNATMFYVAYTADNPDPGKPRPVTFFYNGGPGSSSVYLMLGSFGPSAYSRPSRTSRRLRRTSCSTTPIACSTAPTSSSSIPSEQAIRRRSRLSRTRISGVSTKTRARSTGSSSGTSPSTTGGTRRSFCLANRTARPAAPSSRGSCMKTASS